MATAFVCAFSKSQKTVWRFRKVLSTQPFTVSNTRDVSAASGRESENKRKAKYYRLTAAGKRKFQSETEKWNLMADVIAGILRAQPEEV